MLTLIPKSKNIKCSINLPSSKSESNRALIIEALSKEKFAINNISDCSDSITLKYNLDKIKKYQDQANFTRCLDLNIGACGTAMRFLTAYLSIQQGQYILSGDARMQSRPIGHLVEALLSLGADIKYIHKTGFPPLLITGSKKLTQKTPVIINTSLSSQYLSALLLIAPYINNGINIEIPKSITSKPYIDMTLDMIKKAGIHYTKTATCISIKEQSYKKTDINIQADWSSASYWYSIAALAKSANITLENLNIDSKQADKAIIEIMAILGVKTNCENNSVTITKKDNIETLTGMTINFTNCPDIAQTVIPCFAIQNYKAKFEGLHTLKIKETDRIKALKKELKKINYIFTTPVYGGDNLYFSYKKLQYLDNIYQKDVQIDTYKDHRIAMGFAPLAMKLGKLTILGPEVVNKSYPKFWEDLKKIFIIYDKVF